MKQIDKIDIYCDSHGEHISKLYGKMQCFIMLRQLVRLAANVL